MIRGMVLRANDVPARHLFAACCYCCCTYSSYSLLSVPFGGMLTYLVHKSVQLALNTAQLVPRCGSKDHPPPRRHSRTAQMSYRCSSFARWTGRGLEERTVGVASASPDGCLAACSSTSSSFNRCGRITPTISIHICDCLVLKKFFKKCYSSHHIESCDTCIEH